MPARRSSAQRDATTRLVDQADLGNCARVMVRPCRLRTPAVSTSVHAGRSHPLRTTHSTSIEKNGPTVAAAMAASCVCKPS